MFSAYASTLQFFFLFMFIATFFISFVNIAISGWLLEIVDEKFMGRVQSNINPIHSLFHSIALGIIAITFPFWLSVEALFFATGGLTILAGIFYLVLLPKENRSKEFSTLTAADLEKKERI